MLYILNDMVIVLMPIQSNATSTKTVTRKQRRKRRKTQKRTTLFPVYSDNHTDTSELISDKTVSITVKLHLYVFQGTSKKKRISVKNV